MDGVGAGIERGSVRRGSDGTGGSFALVTARTIIVLACTSAAVAGCADTEAVQDAETGACVESVVYEGTSYEGVRLDRPARHGGRLKGGVVPGCNDTSEIEIGPDGQQTDRTPVEPDRPVALRRIRGVPRALAVARAGGRSTAYLAPGYFPQLAGHPLRGRLDTPARPRGCDGPTTVTGRVEQAGGGGIRLEAGGGRHFDVAVVSDTEIEGFRRAGEPYLQAGDLIRVDGRRCNGRRRLAESISPAP